MNSPAGRREDVAIHDQAHRHHAAATARRALDRRFLCLELLGVIAVLTTVLGLTLDRQSAQELFSEHHLIENLTLAFYLAAVALLLLWPVASSQFRYQTAFLLALAAMRELDFHNAFTSESFMKISYYVDGEDPLWMRVIAGAILLAIIVMLVRCLAYLRPLRSALVSGRPYAYSALAAIVLLPFTKTLDSISRMIHEHIGFDAPDAVRHWFYLFEEAFEMAIPLIVILAVVQYASERPRFAV